MVTPAPSEVPTWNYIKNYAMANGLPIDDPASGYDPNDPWANREPRFYSDIAVDGDKMVASAAAGPDQYIQTLYRRAPQGYFKWNCNRLLL